VNVANAANCSRAKWGSENNWALARVSPPSVARISIARSPLSLCFQTMPDQVCASVHAGRTRSRELGECNFPPRHSELRSQVSQEPRIQN
jgi:hypothetical protein